MKVFVIIYLCFIVSVFLVTIKDFDSVASTPKELYEINNFNMFAAVILFCIMLVLNPLFYIAKFLWWVFHVGRDGYPDNEYSDTRKMSNMRSEADGHNKGTAPGLPE